MREVKMLRMLKHTNIVLLKEAFKRLDSSLKICDFGFSRQLPQNYKGPKLEGGKMTDYVATRWYRSPELLLGYSDYGQEVDMWAIGCIMGELSDGQPLFPGDSEMDTLYLIQKVLGSMTRDQQESFNKNPRFVGLKFPDVTKPETLEKKYSGKLSTKALSLMIGLLKMDPASRLTGEQALLHEYFDDIREPEVDAEMSTLVTNAQRQIYSSQSRVTSYGGQKFASNNPMQTQVVQTTQQNQRQNGSNSKEKDLSVYKNSNAQQQKMHLTNGNGFNINSKRAGGIPLASTTSDISDSRTVSSTKTVNQALSKQKHANGKNTFSGPLHQQKNESKSTGNSQIEHRNQRHQMEAYGGAVPSMAHATQNGFMQNKYQFATFYGQKSTQNQLSGGYEYQIEPSMSIIGHSNNLGQFAGHQRQSNTELNTYSSEKKLHEFANSHQQQHQQYNTNSQQQVIIEEEGGYSQRSSDEEQAANRNGPHSQEGHYTSMDIGMAPHRVATQLGQERITGDTGHDYKPIDITEQEQRRTITNMNSHNQQQQQQQRGRQLKKTTNAVLGGGFRDNSQGIANTNNKPGQPQKFVQKQLMNTNYNNSQFPKMNQQATNGPSNRVNEIFLESQKMIYAPPSREKSKQTVRSPLIEKQPAHNNDEYMLGGTLYAGGMNVNGKKKQITGALSQNIYGQQMYNGSIINQKPPVLNNTKYQSQHN